ncbi:MAG: efflux RND transporter periplasmic adaptor subunit [Gammaproteobacteria bacterium]
MAYRILRTHSRAHRCWWVGARVALTFILSMTGAWAQEMPKPTVSVAIVSETMVTERREYTGRLSAVDAVSLRPRVSGQLLKVNFTEGSVVQAGELLFEIDARPFQAVLDRAQAEYERANAQFQQASREANRGKDLLRRKVISEEEYELRTAASVTAKAQRASAKAELESAALNVAFTRVTAPVSGRLGRAEITAGNWVQAGQTLLTTLVATETLFVDFAVDERVFLESGDQWRVGETRISLGLVSDEGYPHSAVLTFINNRVDPQTGTIQLRATLKQTSPVIRPGLFARVSIPTSNSYAGILINERAIATDQETRYVLTVDENNLVKYTPVTLGPRIDGLRVVRSGLSDGDQLIVKGLTYARPGAPVNVVAVTMKELALLREDKHSRGAVYDGDADPDQGTQETVQ